MIPAAKQRDDLARGRHPFVIC